MATVSSRGDVPLTMAPEPQGSDNGKVGAVDEALARGIRQPARAADRLASLDHDREIAGRHGIEL
jgi:hypothetical protein